MTDLNLIENTPSQDQSLAVEIKNELSGRNVSPVFWWPKYEAAKKAAWIWNFGGISPWGIHEVSDMWILPVNRHKWLDLPRETHSRMFQRLSTVENPSLQLKQWGISALNLW